MTFFDKIAKEAFLEIFSDKLYTPNQNSPVLNTKYLKTSNCTQITKTSGVYVIKHIENGRAVTGQTVNFKGRFNQYTSRASRKKQTGSDNINRVMQFDTQKGFRENKVNFSQLFQRYIIYSWRSNLSKSLEMNAQQSLLEQGENVLEIKNEMNYLEHRLILAFYECNLTYNTVDSAPQFHELLQLPSISTTEIIQETPVFQSQILEKPDSRTKPFKYKGEFFLSSGDLRAALQYRNQPQVNMTRIRKELRSQETNSNSDTRYLTETQIQEALEQKLFLKVRRESSPYLSRKKKLDSSLT